MWRPGEWLAGGASSLLFAAGTLLGFALAQAYNRRYALKHMPHRREEAAEESTNGFKCDSASSGRGVIAIPCAEPRALLDARSQETLRSDLVSGSDTPGDPSPLQEDFGRRVSKRPSLRENSSYWCINLQTFQKAFTNGRALSSGSNSIADRLPSRSFWGSNQARPLDKCHSMPEATGSIRPISSSDSLPSQPSRTLSRLQRQGTLASVAQLTERFMPLLTDSTGGDSSRRGSRVKLERNDGRGDAAAKESTCFAKLVKEAYEREQAPKEDVAWLNRLAVDVWPRMQEYVRNLVQETVEPAINRQLPSFLQSRLHFEQVRLGRTTPTFGPLTTWDTDGGSTVELRCGVRWEPVDLRLEVAAVAFRVAVTKLKLEAEVSVVFSPELARPPFFGGLKVYMVNPPKLDLEFEVPGLLSQAKYIKPAVRNALHHVLADLMVLPNRIAVDMDLEDDVDIADLRRPDPVGVLRFTLLRAEKLIAADRDITGSMSSSDPYVVVRVGATQWRSPTVAQNLNPVWGEPGVGLTTDFPVHDASQHITVQVFDEDYMQHSDLIGVALDLSLGSVASCGGAGREVRVQLKDQEGAPKAGALFVRLDLLDLRDWIEPSRRLSGPSAVYLALKVREVKCISFDLLPATPVPPFKVEVQFGEAQGCTRWGYGRSNQGVTYEMQKLCMDMLRQHRHLEEIMQTLGLKEDQVLSACLRNNPDDPGVRQAVREAVRRRAATNPQFEDVVQLLSPDPSRQGRRASVEIRLVDKKGTVIGEASVGVDLSARAGPRLPEPAPLSVRLEPVGATLHGALHAKFLAGGPTV